MPDIKVYIFIKMHFYAYICFKAAQYTKTEAYICLYRGIAAMLFLSGLYTVYKRFHDVLYNKRCFYCCPWSLV